MRTAAAATALAIMLVLVMAARADTQRISQHTAKLRTFEALLHETEQAPDAVDATQASVTVGRCKRYGTGWLCHGSLRPVFFSGIDTESTCPFIVVVTARRTRVHDSQCT